MSILEIGDCRVDRVLELEAEFEPGWLIPGATPEDVLRQAEHLGSRLINTANGHLKITVQSHVIRCPGRTIVIDTGVGNGRSRPSVPVFDHLDTRYLENMGAIGVRREDVDTVICTHLHVDHVGWNVMRDGDRFVPTFPNADYIVTGSEYGWWKRAHADGGTTPQAKAAFDECVEPLMRMGKLKLVADDERIVAGATELQLEPLPGHTMHQSGVHLRSAGRHGLFTADAAHHAVQFIHGTWRSRADTDHAVGNRTIAGLIERYANTDTIFLTSHSPSPSACRLVTQGGVSKLVFLDA